MANSKSSVRFDHREVAVVFSLFIFVSLLMFTVGILVGKGLTQAHYEGMLGANAPAGLSARSPASESDSAMPVAPAPQKPSTDAAAVGTSVSTDDNAAPRTETSITTGPTNTRAATAPNAQPALSGDAAVKAATGDVGTADTQGQDLKLIPAKPGTEDVRSDVAAEFPKTKEVDRILNNPKMRGLIDDGGGSTAQSDREIASTSSPSRIPASYAQGRYTVQVGAYPSQRDAAERVESLKKLGFPYAFLSAKQMVDSHETWYRVCLGYFPNSEAARRGGEVLAARGEVKNYVVRNVENE